MADHHPSSSHTDMNTSTRRPTTLATTTTTTTTHTLTPLLRKLQGHVSNSTQLFGLLTLLITGTVSLLLMGLSVVGTTMGLVLFSPLIVLLSPIWGPPCFLIFLVTAVFLSFCGFGVVIVALLSWVYRYFRRHRSLDSYWVDSASHVKDYGRDYEYGGGDGYLQSNKVIHAAPGA